MFTGPHKKSLSRRLTIGMFVLLLIVGQLGGLFFGVETAKAGPLDVVSFAAGAASIPVGVNSDIPATVSKVEAGIEDTIVSAFLGSLMAGFTFMTRQLAYDAAQGIAASARGEKSLIFSDQWDVYLGNVAGATAGEMVGKFGEALPFLGELGINLCQFPSLDLQIYLQVGLARIWNFGPPAPPTCSWQQLKNGWDPHNIMNNLRDTGHGLANQGRGVDTIEKLFSKVVQQNQDDFSIMSGAILAVDEKVDLEREAKKAERAEGGGYSPVIDPVSGNIRTPASMIGLTAQMDSPKWQMEQNNILAAGFMNAGLDALVSASAIFINTLAGQMLTDLFAGKYWDSSGGSSAGAGAGDYYASAVQNNRQAAAKAFAYLLVVPPMPTGAMDIVSVFAACPRSGTPGINNCVMDSQLQRAITVSKNETITIQSAMDKGYLRKDGLLISPDRVADNGNVRGCYMNNYCYSNIQKMRKVRILPLGFEIAAMRSDPDQPWTLGQVVAGFEDCAYDPISKQVIADDPNHPFCHLIDPNWVIKAPAAFCEANVYDAVLATPEAPVRQKECLDISTCINQDAVGNCKDYGYCLQEKNAWQFPGQSCEAQNATCKTYTNTTDNSIASYLSRTVDFGDCRADTVGCRAYSTEKSGDNWVSSFAWDNTADKQALWNVGRNKVINFNDQILNQQCSTTAEGCSLFTSTSTGSKNYLRKAPDYLNCYDRDSAIVGVQLPRTEAELNLVSQSTACDKFANVCLADEVGCDQFTPTLGGLAVPGKVGDNFCPAACVGYAAYNQVSSYFEPAKDNLYFIPAKGRQCSAVDVGCVEFTNLEAVAAGGEGLEYYNQIKHCEKPILPGRDNEKIYYTWEGSETEGYNLRVHKLKPTTDGPAYADMRNSVLTEKNNKCNQQLYLNRVNSSSAAPWSDPDCREFFDEVGHASYRLLQDTVVIDSACKELRKTDNYLFAVESADLNGLGQTACENNLHGLWGGSSCQICYGGGRYEGGACVYSVLASESHQCSAAANGCRAYAGNLANNVYQVFNYDFEPFGTSTIQSKLGWSAGAEVVAESVYVGGHSLRLSGNANVVIATNTMRNLPQAEDIAYELVFWARGTGVNLKIELTQTGVASADFTKNIITQAAELVSVGNAWQEYHLGPIKYAGVDSAITNLQFTASGAGNYYLDNVRLTRVQGVIPLIKNSWQTTAGVDAPYACDANPSDGLPGAALGCQAYNAESTGETAYATGFARLCREKAVGCSPLIDTFNTTNVGMTAYNVWCAKTSNFTDYNATTHLCSLYTEMDDDTVKVGTTDSDTLLGSCEVLTNQDGCFITNSKPIVVPSTQEAKFTNPANGLAVISTIIIPADTDSSSPIYLANRKSFRCTEQSLGCQQLAVETHNLPTADVGFDYSPSFILNNPAKYGDTLCRGDQVGCSEFKTDKGVSFFKDPKQIGNKLCTYRDGTGGSAVDKGWFMEGVGKCVGTENLCRSKDDCGGTVECTNIGNVACYNNFVLNGLTYELWSNKAPLYQGFVGKCPATENNCTEFVDPVDVEDTTRNLFTPSTRGGGVQLNLRLSSTQQAVQGKPYYAIFDDNLTKRTGECNGMASQREGCVLFDQTDNPQEKYNAVATYADSEKAVKEGGSSLVVPNVTAQRNANIIVKVDRDRVCSEWLACKNSVTHRDASGNPFQLCYQYAPCNKMENGNCVNFVASELDQTKTYLDQATYVSRNTSWQGNEYSGYSLFNRYPVGDFSPAVITLTTGGTKKYLVYKLKESLFASSTEFSCDPDAPTNIDDMEWQKCGFNDEGRCVKGNCLVPIDGAFPSELTLATVNTLLPGRADILEAASCKAFPEKDSPFTQGVLVTPLKPDDDKLKNEPAIPGVWRYDFADNKPRQQDFSKVNVCQDGNCSCEYKKISFANGTVDYWPLQQAKNTLPTGICVGGRSDFGSLDGFPCDPARFDDDCLGDGKAPGTCSPVKQIDKVMGTTGYCLERDLSRPINGGTEFACLTWLPLQISASGLDVYGDSDETGYLPSADAKAADGNSYGQVYCQNSTGLGAGGEYDNNKLLVSADRLASKNKISVNNYYNSVFNANGIPRSVYNVCVGINSADNNICNYHNIGTDCTSDSKCKLADPADFPLGTQINPLFVEVSADEGKTYTLMQTWGWGLGGGSSFTGNRMLLRFDNSGIADSSGGSFAPNVVTSEGHPRVFSPEQSDGEIVWTSSMESKIKEQDIKRVYFVPLGYIGKGAVDRNPAIGSADIVIDFSKPNEFKNSPKSAAATSNVGLSGSSDCRTNPGGNFKISSDYAGKVYTYLAENPSSSVARRYVTIFGTDNNFPKPDGNPFADDAPCFGDAIVYNGTDDTIDRSSGTGNWVAIGMNFDADGDFLGYISNYCNGDTALSEVDFTEDSTNLCNKNDASHLGRVGDIEGNGIKFAVVAELNDRCTEVAQVYNEDVDLTVGGQTNKAWTDKVWSGASSNKTSGVSPYSFFTKSFLNSPFGSLPFVGADVTTTSKLIRNSQFVEPGAYHPGVPFSCMGGWMSGSSIIDAESRCDGLPASLTSPDIRRNLNRDQNQLPSNTQLDNLFADVFAVINTIDSSNTLKPVVDDALGKRDTSDNQFLGLLPPQLYSLNPTTCGGGEIGQQKCTAGEQGMTVNTKNFTTTDYNSDGSREEDRNANGVPDGDGLIGVNTKAVTLQFFAFADHNRMPIRRIMVDWGDGGQITNQEMFGYYKNRKPYCAADNEAECKKPNGSFIGLTCQSDAECQVIDPSYLCRGNIVGTSPNHFGNSTRACEQGYFEFAYDYSCTAEERSHLVGNITVGQTVGSIQGEIGMGDMYNSLKTMGYADSQPICVYQPRVQVLDNWGWCNGSCNGTNGQPYVNGGCYNDEVNGNWQCNNSIFPHWTPYGGKIIVIPNNE